MMTYSSTILSKIKIHFMRKSNLEYLGIWMKFIYIC